MLSDLLMVIFSIVVWVYLILGFLFSLMQMDAAPGVLEWGGTVFGLLIIWSLFLFIIVLPLLNLLAWMFEIMIEGIWQLFQFFRTNTLLHPRNALLQDYLSRLDCAELQNPSASLAIWHRVNMDTLRLLHDLAGKQKATVVQRLYDAGGLGARPQVELRGANLQKTVLKDASLRRINLTGANLWKANLTGTILDHATLADTNLAGATLEHAALVDADLTHANLTRARLTTVNLSRANLHEAQLIGARLTDANLTEANLQEAQLTGAILDHANLITANLTKANLTRAHLTAVNLSRANLQEAHLTGAILDHANLITANLTGATLQQATLVDTDLSGANLTVVHLIEANLTKANLQEAHLTGAILDHANLITANLTGATLQQATLVDTDLTHANLTEANLQEAHLTDAILDHAILVWANLATAQLTGASLHGATLTGANLQGADLTQCQGLTLGQLCETAALQGAKLPDYIDPSDLGTLWSPPPHTPTPTTTTTTANAPSADQSHPIPPLSVSPAHAHLTLWCPACQTAAPLPLPVCPDCGLLFTSRLPPSWQPPPPYTLLRPLATGGMSHVYLVHNPTTDQLAVLKTLATVDGPQPTTWVADAHTCLTHEATLLQTLDHPGLPQVYAWYPDPTVPALLLTYVAGPTLDQVLTTTTPPPLPTILWIGAQMAQTLAYLAARPQPVVHGDLKPANLILPPTGAPPVLIDLGSATLLPHLDHPTDTVGYGTPGFAAPEQYQGHVTPTTDSYGLGATLYYLLTADDPSTHPLTFPALATLPLPLADLLQALLATDPTTRPDATTTMMQLEHLRETMPITTERNAP